MKLKTTTGLCLIAALYLNSNLKGQEKQDSLKIKTVIENTETKEEKNRNVMLNAANNTGPRDVNIGLPPSAAGINIQENDMPIVYFPWPEDTNRSWRQSVSFGSTGLMKISEAAITTGNLGFVLNSYSKLGGDKTEVAGSLGGSHFGWMKGDINVSGPLGNKWYFTAGVYANYDPSTYDLKFTKYSDRTQIYRTGITKRFSNGKGEISLLYKYANSASLGNFAIFKYKEGGKVEELDNFRIGRDSYIVNDGILKFKDIRSGETKFGNMAGQDAATISHSFDLIGNYQLANDWKFNFNTRFRYSEATQLSTTPLSVFHVAGTDGYTNLRTGQVYSGPVNSMMAMFTDGVPTKTLLSRFELKKKKENHNYRIGLTEYYYNIDQYTSSRSYFYQTATAAPDKLLLNQLGGTANTDADGFYNYNVGGEYHNGYENKLSGYFSDDWNVTDWFSLSYGFNLRYQKVKGDFYETPRYDGIVFDSNQKSNIDNNWFHIGGAVNATFKITKKAGLLADFTYTQSNGQLENYSGFIRPSLDKAKIPVYGIGVYYNDPLISVVSQATYLKRDKFLNRLNLVNPNDGAQTQVATVLYDIETVGWTTDIVTNPFKGFSLHYLITFQNPVYKNYDFSAFGNNYSYNNKNVLEVSKVLMEIDPSYQFNKFRIWTSFRYYSKQFANLTNELYFAPRWETFGGVNYKLSDHFDIGVTAVNFLNQRGAKGTISGAELITDPTPYYNQILTGSYIRPFTLEAAFNFRF